MLIYVIQAGDTFFAIARRYNVLLEDILNLNSLTGPGQLVIGQVILIPGPSPRALQYTPVMGDSLYTLA
jgi:LysM repeat protein